MRMPEDKKEIELDGIYKGFILTANLAVPMMVFSYIQTGQWGLIQMALRQILLSWNFTDQEGKPLPQPNEMVQATDPMGETVLVQGVDKTGQPLMDEENKPVMVPFMVPGVSFIPINLGMIIITKVTSEIGNVSTP